MLIVVLCGGNPLLRLGRFTQNARKNRKKPFGSGVQAAYSFNF